MHTEEDKRQCKQIYPNGNVLIENTKRDFLDYDDDDDDDDEVRR